MSAVRKFLSLSSGQTWRTVNGRLVEILTLDMTGTSDFPLSGEFIAGADGFTKINWHGLTTCGDQLSEQIHTAVTAAPIVSDYLEAAIDDELTLAALLHWQNFTKPEIITPRGWIYGTHNSRNGHVRNGSVPMPAWRREWAGAGELVSLCKLHIEPSLAGVAVSAETGDTFRTLYREHPSEDDAIRFAMCKAAIVYLRGGHD